MLVDSGYIKITVGEVGSQRKMIDIAWCFQFKNNTEANKFFKSMIALFTPLSTMQKQADDTLNGGKFAEFSIKGENTRGIKDVTFFLNKSAINNKYEINFIPYNEFME